MTDDVRLEHSHIFMTHVHDPKLCEGRACVLHNRSQNHTRGWQQWWRSDRKMIGRGSPFGVNCPDPDMPWPADSVEWVHGCVLNPLSDTGVCVPWQYHGVDATWVTSNLFVTKEGRMFLADESEVTTTVSNNRRKYDGLDVANVVWSAWNGEIRRGYQALHSDDNIDPHANYFKKLKVRKK